MLKTHSVCRIIDAGKESNAAMQGQFHTVSTQWTCERGATNRFQASSIPIDEHFLSEITTKKKRKTKKFGTHLRHGLRFVHLGDLLGGRGVLRILIVADAQQAGEPDKCFSKTFEILNNS